MTGLKTTPRPKRASAEAAVRVSEEEEGFPAATGSGPVADDDGGGKVCRPAVICLQGGMV
jgi:hypothetical protein